MVKLLAIKVSRSISKPFACYVWHWCGLLVIYAAKCLHQLAERALYFAQLARSPQGATAGWGPFTAVPPMVFSEGLVENNRSNNNINLRASNYSMSFAQKYLEQEQFVRSSAKWVTDMVMVKQMYLC